MLILLSPLSFAGWADLIFTSPQDGQQVRQGDNITLTLFINNSGISDGNAAYTANVTLLPSACINNGVPLLAARGALVCPNTSLDSACAFRFRNAVLQDTYAFTNLTTDEACPNGEYHYSFLLEGNSEVGDGGSFSATVKNATAKFAVRFTGPRFCGDGSCDGWKGENCSECPRDCGRCPECVPGARRCEGDSIAECNSSGLWKYSACPGGCLVNVTGEPECIPPCAQGEKQCIAENTLSICESGKWRNITCPLGCLYDDCRGNCQTAGCPESCSDSLHLLNGTCGPVTGRCTYKSEYCERGCDGAGVRCMPGATPTPTPAGGFNALPVAAGALLLIAVAAVIYLKFIRK